METLRILKAFAWMRWRMLINSFEKTGSRDVLERFSLAIEKLGPLLAAILLIPSALFLAALGVTAGFFLATGRSPVPLAAVRYLLIPIPLLAIVGPLFLPAADRTNPVRMLLLPIRTTTLYVAQAAGAFADPWTFLMLPLVAGVPVGLAAGGGIIPALICAAAAVLFVLLVVGISALSTSVLHLLVRDRRRGEMLALLFIVAIPVIAMLPGLLRADSDSPRRRHPDALVPTWVAAAGTRVAAFYPSEVFMTGTRSAAEGEEDQAIVSLGTLALAAGLVHAIGFVAFSRVLGSPGSTGAKRSAPMRAAWTAKLPGLSVGASAIALAQLRLALRTPRGRSILLSPLAMLVIFGLMMYRSGDMDFGPFQFDSGLGLAAFASFMCLVSILPIAMNQFAVDRAGLTMTLLSPLRDEEILSGKAAGNALVAAPPALFSIAAALLVFPGGPAAMWAALVLGLISVYLVVAPIAALCSAVFPRSVDMNSIGRGSNAHGAAGLIGMLAFVVAALPPLFLTVAATRLLERPALAPVLLAAWCAVAYGIGRALFVAARRVFVARRENLAMLD